MYSKNNSENEKEQRSIQMTADNGFYYFVNGIKISNFPSFPPPFNLNMGDNINMMKMSKRFQQELELFSNSPYEYEDALDDDKFKLISKSSLPSSSNAHKHNYQQQQHNNHHDTTQNQNLQQEQEHHQFQRQHHRGYRHQQNRHHHHNSNKNLNEDVCNRAHNIPPPPFSVHQSSINNRNNNYYKKYGDCCFSGDSQSLPTPECSHLQSFDQTRISDTASSEQHYQHYYSYFYNCNPPKSPKAALKSGRGRKLPTTSKMMPFSKKSSSHSTESPLLAKYEMMSEQNNLIADNDKTNSNINNSRDNNYQNYVLKEKIVNNNEVIVSSAGYDNANWHYDSSNVVDHVKMSAEGGYLDAKAIVTHEYDSHSICYEDQKVEYIMQQQKNKRKLRTISESSGNDCNNHSALTASGTDTTEFSKNVLNNHEGGRNDKKMQSPNNNNLEIIHRTIKLPATPTKIEAVTPVKKSSPPPKNRRVLIYNIQSPRLSRLSTSNIRLQRSKFKLQNEPKDDKSNPNASSPINKSAADNRIRVISSMGQQKVCDPNDKERNQLCDKTKETLSYIVSGDDNSDDDDYDDDDLDHASDFDTTTDSDISSDSEEGYRTYAYKLTHPLDAVSTTPSLVSSLNSEESLDNPDSLLVPSLFPNVPPYLAFSSNTKKGPEVPADLYRILKWRVTNVMPRVVRNILSNSGMRLLKKTNDWMGVWGKHMKSPCFKTIRPYQKINHLPGSFKIGRKDSCWKNLVKLMGKHGKKDFGFMPKTYIIPNDLKQLRKSWPKYAQRNVKWIIKPPASARGTGIRVVDRWAQIPKRKPLIVQKYIERPLLINGSKFDLRLYVLVTSINPLRVYMYHNGLARFASVKYSDKSDTLNDRCMHLTNYSINKFSSNYSKNEDVNACHGHKWTIKSLWNYLSSRGVRTELLWAALRSLVLRTILAGENSINNMIRANVESKYSCFELFGFDVLLDADLVPWLLEVNISPSLHSELPLDSHVKAPLVQSVLNTALYNIPPKIPIERQREIAMEMSLPPGPICYDKRMYINYLSRTEKIKHSTFTRKNMEDRDEYIDGILDHLTPDDVRCLVIAEDELARCSPLERIFPTTETHKYLKYTETPRYYNRLLDAWETRYGNNRIEGIYLLRQYCEDRYHLQVPQIPTKKPLNYRTRAMMKIRPTSLALTIASSSNKWRSLRRKMRMAHINNALSASQADDDLKNQLFKQISYEEEVEEEATKESNGKEYTDHRL